MEASKQRDHLSSLPSELLHVILSLLTSKDLLAAAQTSTTLRAHSDDPRIWRDLCLRHYKYWKRKHAIQSKTSAPVATIAWKSLYQARWTADQLVERSLNEGVNRQSGRLVNFQRIPLVVGEDAKDYIIRQCHTPASEEDWMARRHWSRAVLTSINRAYAVRMWGRLAAGEDMPIEQAFMALDGLTFGLGRPAYDELDSYLDDFAQLMIEADPKIQTASTRYKALAIAALLRKEGFTGVDTSTYTALRNNYISRAISDPEHHCLPLLQSVIYCAVARRFGLTAMPTNFPMHIYTVVHAPPGQLLDGEETGPDSKPEVMFVDPFRNADEVPPETLHQLLEAMGLHPNHHELYLQPARTKTLLLRASYNVIRSLRQGDDASDHDEPSPDDPFHKEFLPPASSTDDPAPTRDQDHSSVAQVAPLGRLDVKSAFYAASWAHVLFKEPPAAHDPVTGNPIDPAVLQRERHRENETWRLLLDQIRDHSPIDAPLFEEHLYSLVEDSSPELHSRADALSQLSQLNSDDASIDVIWRRHAPPNTSTSHPPPDHDTTNIAPLTPNHKIGTLFRHRRYAYIGLIVGWDTRCRASESWIRQMGVDLLPGGRAQCFYHIREASDNPDAGAHGGSGRYVAEENIRPLGWWELTAGPPSMVSLERQGDTASEEDDEEEEEEEEKGEEAGAGTARRRRRLEVDEEERKRREAQVGPLPVGVPAGLLRGAGEYFRRWDWGERRFVSNLREQYPDD